MSFPTGDNDRLTESLPAFRDEILTFSDRDDCPLIVHDRNSGNLIPSHDFQKFVFSCPKRRGDRRPVEYLGDGCVEPDPAQQAAPDVTIAYHTEYFALRIHHNAE